MNRFRQKNQQPDSKPSEQPQPLREFKDSSVGATPTKLRYRLTTTAYWLLPVIVFLSIIAVGTYVALRHYSKDGASTESVERVVFSSASNEIEVPELMNAYLAAIGGRAALEEVRSVRYDGRVLFATSESDFQMLLLKPDKGMLVTYSGQSPRLRLMLNGDTAWQVIEQQDGSRDVAVLGEDSTQSLMWSLRVDNTFRNMALEGRTSGLSVNEIEFKGKPCYELTKTKSDGSAIVGILDKETLYLLETKETLTSKQGTNEFTVNYDDHRMISGVVEPYKTTLYRNGELDNRVMVDSIRINSGVISSLFEVPDEVLK